MAFIFSVPKTPGSTKSLMNGRDSLHVERKQAIVKPVLTHVIEGFVIQEATEPFPVSCTETRLYWLVGFTDWDRF